LNLENSVQSVAVAMTAYRRQRPFDVHTTVSIISNVSSVRCVKWNCRLATSFTSWQTKSSCAKLIMKTLKPKVSFFCLISILKSPSKSSNPNTVWSYARKSKEVHSHFCCSLLGQFHYILFSYNELSWIWKLEEEIFIKKSV
jgi:hypothetical protein